MRVLSQYTNPTAQIRPQRQRSLGDGTIEVTQEPIYATFKPLQAGAFLYENEEIAALKHFNFHGNTQDIGEAIPTDPLARISVFDSDEVAKEEGWDEATQAEVEAKLREYAANDPMSFLIVETTPIAAPFPAYDSYEGDTQALVVKLIEDGYDVEQVLYYERIFGQKRPEIIAALEEAVEVKQEMVVSA